MAAGGTGIAVVREFVVIASGSLMEIEILPQDALEAEVLTAPGQPVFIEAH